MNNVLRALDEVLGLTYMNVGRMHTELKAAQDRIKELEVAQAAEDAMFSMHIAARRCIEEIRVAVEQSGDFQTLVDAMLDALATFDAREKSNSRIRDMFTPLDDPKEQQHG